MYNPDYQPFTDTLLQLTHYINNLYVYLLLYIHLIINYLNLVFSHHMLNTYTQLVKIKNLQIIIIFIIIYIILNSFDLSNSRLGEISIIHTTRFHRNPQGAYLKQM